MSPNHLAFESEWWLACLYCHKNWADVVSKPIKNASKTVQAYEQKHQFAACFPLLLLWDVDNSSSCIGWFFWYCWRLIKNPIPASDTQSFWLYWILKVFRSWKITTPANSMLYLSTVCLQENELAILSEIVCFGRCDSTLTIGVEMPFFLPVHCLPAQRFSHGL